MKVTLETLTAESRVTGFRPEVLEKVIQLLNLLEGFTRHPYLKGRLALKGGTALNLFFFGVPRLSVDIDLNYVGAIDRDTMFSERPKVEQAVHAVCLREDMTVTRVPTDHAGGKWRLRYESTLGGSGNLEVDLNFMCRVPLWPMVTLDAQVGSFSALQIPVLDLHELAAGKLAALLARRASRDLFDAHHLLTRYTTDRQQLRLGFVLYGAMNRRDWRTVTVDDVAHDERELKSQLIPVLRNESLAARKLDDWATRMIAECRDRLREVLPMMENEIKFLDHLFDEGRIEPELLTTDETMAERIKSHPLLRWKAANVLKLKGG